jgi:hypothetical protein
MQENIDRFMALSEYDVKGEATVKFKAGSAKISPEDEEKTQTVSRKPQRTSRDTSSR